MLGTETPSASNVVDGEKLDLRALSLRVKLLEAENRTIKRAAIEWSTWADNSYDEIEALEQRIFLLEKTINDNSEIIASLNNNLIQLKENISSIESSSQTEIDSLKVHLGHLEEAHNTALARIETLDIIISTNEKELEHVSSMMGEKNAKIVTLRLEQKRLKIRMRRFTQQAWLIFLCIILILSSYFIYNSYKYPQLLKLLDNARCEIGYYIYHVPYCTK